MVTTHTGTSVIRDCRSTQEVFAVTNWSSDVAMNCDAAADAEIADVLGTLIKVLIEQGILNGSVATA